jgi:phosphotransferase system enzyme I (PtsI)
MIGIGASPGIAIGKAFVLNHQEINVSIEKIKKAEIVTELEKLQVAVEKSKEQLESIIEKTYIKLGSSEAMIFKAQLLILEDPEFIGQIKYIIETQLDNAALATKKTYHKFACVFDNMKDEYIKERAADIKDVGTRIIKNLLGIQSFDLGSIDEESIIIAHDLSPSDTMQLNKEKVLGFGTDIGGVTSHIAIMAKSIEIPAVLGAGNITSQVKAGDLIILDGVAGRIFVNPKEEMIDKYRKKIEEYNLYIKELQKLKDLPAETKDGHRVKITGNIGMPKEVDGVINNGGQGIGLYRTEFLYMNRDTYPSEEEQFRAYRDVLLRMKGKPIIIRTLDIGGDKSTSCLNLPQEKNPFLGFRAIRLSLGEEEIFKEQLRAILRASVFGQASIMYPMITGIDEVKQANALLEEAKKELDAKNIPYDMDIKVGIMIETPSAALTADIIAREVEFFSIGTNDLCQYTLAVDRINENVSYLYQPFHPAILRLIKNIIDISKHRGITIGMCGEMAGDPMSILILLGFGLREFSMSPQSIPQIKEIIRSVTLKQAQNIAQEALSLTNPDEIKDMIIKKLNTLNIKTM